MYRVTPDEFGLDEFFVDDVKSVHIERMGSTVMWVGIDCNDGTHHRINLWTNGTTPIRALHEID